MGKHRSGRVRKVTGKRVLGPIDGNLLWSGFGGNCERFNDGDPVVIYDKIADRWLLTQFAVTQAPFSQCIAVSTSADPTGTYARYEYQYADFNDYPKFGVCARCLLRYFQHVQRQ